MKNDLFSPIRAETPVAGYAGSTCLWNALLVQAIAVLMGIP